MADFTSIWDYIQRQLKVTIPPYIKNVLLFCGFDNCYTIATIVEKDLECIQGEIRSGGLTEFFKHNYSGDFQPKNILEGSTKSVREFEFSRGHQKLILSIAKLVKDNLDKNGIDGFGSIKRYAETFEAKKKTSVDENQSNVPFKRQKTLPVELAINSVVSEANNEQMLKSEPSAEHVAIHSHEIAIHRSKLIEQALSSLRNDTPALFKENSAIIQAAVTSNLVTVTKKKKGPGYSAKINCPYCKENISVFHILKNVNDQGTWNSSNFGRHLENVHLKTTKPKKTKKKAKQNVDSGSDDNTAMKPGENILDTKPGDNFVPHIIVEGVVSTTVNKTVFQSIVDYSDTDESGNNDENLILIEVPSDPAIKPAMIKYSEIDGETFILMSNESLESLEEISIQYPDSLYQSDLSIEMRKDFDEGTLVASLLQSRVFNPNDQRLAKEDSIGADNIEVVPVFRNGYKSTNTIPTIYTVNTCAFDSVLSIYTCSYFENQCYRQALGLFVGQSRFSELIKKTFDHFQSEAPVGSMRELYDDSNLILKEIFSSSYYIKCDNMMKNSQYIFIDCATGIGGLFGQICTQLAENIASTIELKICSVCETTTGKILPFFTIDYSKIELRNIQKSISPELPQDRLCITCKSKCFIDKILNDILVLEVEPNCKIEFQKTIPIQHLTDTITIKNQYELLAVVEFDPTINHFLSHVKRENNVWKTYDDLKSSESITDVAKEIYPYLLFYKQKTLDVTDHNDFKRTLLSFFRNNELRKPLVRKILPSERCMSTRDSQLTTQASLKTTSFGGGDDFDDDNIIDDQDEDVAFEIISAVYKIRAGNVNITIILTAFE